VNSTEELFGKLVDGTPLIRLHTERPSTHVILTARPQLERLVLRCAPLGRVLR
jgi:superfamily I DNA and RNA helicase